MTTIKKIADIIQKTIESVRPPQATLPAILIACSAINRPGLSAIELASRVISKQRKHGLAHGPLPDGSQNGYETIIKIFSEEIVDMLKYKSRIQTATPIGGTIVTVWGSNAGGPFVGNGFNVTATKGDGYQT